MSDTRLLLEGIRSAIPDREPQRYLYELVADYPSREAGLLRPLLCLWTCRAYGGRTEEVVEVAVAIELLHNAFLVHDDIEDHSRRRRGRPTLHELHGVPLAVNAGDALVALALTTLVRATNDLPPEVARRLLPEFAHLMQRTVEGQSTDLGWARDEVFEVTEADYLAMIRNKTCWYSTIHPMRLGAIVGSGGRADVDRLTAYGFFLGALFQIEDDLANLAGDQSYSKDLGSDILEGKRTLMFVHLLHHADANDRDVAVEYLSPDCSVDAEERIAVVLGLMRRYGSLEYAQSYKDALAGAAVAALRDVFADRIDHPDVEAMLQLVLRFRRAHSAS